MIKYEINEKYEINGEDRIQITVDRKDTEHFIEERLDWQKRGLQQTSTGYGGKLTSPYKVKYNNRWYRVYSACYSNVSTEYILVKGQWVFVQIW